MIEINWLAYNQEGELLQRYGTVNANTEKSEWNNYWLIPAGTTTIYIEYRTQTYQYLAYLVVALTLLALAGTAWYQSRRAKNVRKEVDKLLNDSIYRNKMLDDYDEIIDILGKPGASTHAAIIIVDKIKKRED